MKWIEVKDLGIDGFTKNLGVMPKEKWNVWNVKACEEWLKYFGKKESKIWIEFENSVENLSNLINSTFKDLKFTNVDIRDGEVIQAAIHLGYNYEIGEKPKCVFNIKLKKFKKYLIKRQKAIIKKIPLKRRVRNKLSWIIYKLKPFCEDCAFFLERDDSGGFNVFSVNGRMLSISKLCVYHNTQPKKSCKHFHWKIKAVGPEERLRFYTEKINRKNSSLALYLSIAAIIITITFNILTIYLIFT